MGAREEPSPGTVATRGGAPQGPPHLPNVGSPGWRVGTARGGGHRQGQGQGQQGQGQGQEEQEQEKQEQEEQEQEPEEQEQEQQHRLPAGSAAPGHARALPGAGLGALADILASQMTFREHKSHSLLQAK